MTGVEASSSTDCSAGGLGVGRMTLTTSTWVLRRRIFGGGLRGGVSYAAVLDGCRCLRFRRLRRRGGSRKRWPSGWASAHRDFWVRASLGWCGCGRGRAGAGRCRRRARGACGGVLSLAWRLVGWAFFLGAFWWESLRGDGVAVLWRTGVGWAWSRVDESDRAASARMAVMGALAAHSILGGAEPPEQVLLY